MSDLAWQLLLTFVFLAIVSVVTVRERAAKKRAEAAEREAVLRGMGLAAQIARGMGAQAVDDAIREEITKISRGRP